MRGHFVFAQPEGRTLGNSLGKLAGGWGDIRGENGVILAAPTVHPAGGCYEWIRAGMVPVLPPALADELGDAPKAVEAATDPQVTAFLEAHQSTERMELLDVHVHAFNNKVAAGESRHHCMNGHLTGAMKEARAGYLPADLAANTLEGLFLAAVKTDGYGGQRKARTPDEARSEWDGMLAWAVAQAASADLDAVRARVEEKFPPLTVLQRATPATPSSPEAAQDNTEAALNAAPTAITDKVSVATQLVDLALTRWHFKVSAEDEPFARPLDGAQVVRLLTGSRSIRAELADLFQQTTGKVAGQQALADAILVLEGRGRREDPVPLAPRVAYTDSAVWLDLGTVTGEAVKVTTAGWEVVDKPSILLRRTALTGALTAPEAGGDLAELWKLLNVAPESQPVLLGWLVAALLPGIPHPIAALVGEQGTGKSTASRMLAGLLDPSPAQLRKPPRDVEGWTTAAAGSWVAVDNLSAIPAWWSDSLCRAVTGDGDVRRRLYSDADLTVFAFRRVVLLNGIDLGAVRDDLGERLLTVELQPITERRYDADLANAWQDAHPRILGALLDLAAQVLKVMPEVTLTDPPRMADFARVLAAVDKVTDSQGLATYRRLATVLAADAVDGDPVLAAITRTITREFTGTAAGLLSAIGPRDWDHRREWPSDARAMTALLRRRAPALRRGGWTVEDKAAPARPTPFSSTSWRPPEASDEADRAATRRRGERREHRGERQARASLADYRPS